VDCKFHPKQWVCHSSDECSKNPSNSDSAPKGAPKTSNNSRRLKAAKLAAAILEDDDGDSADESQGEEGGF
jgi:hypothetical protein